MRRMAWTAAVAVVTASLMQALRVAFPLLYDVREDAGASTAVLWALVAFVVAPAMLAPILLRAGGGFRVAVVGVAIARLAEQLVHPIPVWLGAVSVGTGMTALAVLVVVGRRRDRGAETAIAIVAGLALDAALLGAFETWDAVWQDGPAAITVAVVLAVAAVVAASAAEPDGDRLDVDAWPLVAIGPFLLVQLLFVQNIAFTTSSTGAPIAGGVALVLLGSVLGVLAASWAIPRNSGAVRRGAGVVLVAAVGALALVQGSSAAVAVPIASAAAAVVLTVALSSPAGARRNGPTAQVLWFVIGIALFVGAAFAYQIDIDVPLPVPRATWPIAAAVALAAVVVRRHRPEPVSAVPALIPLIGAIAVPLLLLDVGSRPDPVGAPDTYRVLDWNIHTAVDGDGQIVLGEVLDLIRSRDPDVVVLQEVGRGWPIAGQSDDLQWLARRLDMGHAWAPAADGQFGNAILSRFPIDLDRVIALPYGEGPQERSAIAATIGTDPGLFVVGVHLQHGDRPATRADQIDAVLDVWGGTDAWLLAGDLNMQPGSTEVGRLEEIGLTSVQDMVGDPTAPTARDPVTPDDRVDWIWVTSDTLEVANFAIVRSEASDHLPLVADVTPRG
ncbi:MAG TPA: endonuclease/exonuclease/phosphatase family protein [Actinomycetota bacterium]|nr:endonuclease/exonuclease/phosphatase family protein [Actinomycetota bacterium]